MLGETRTKGLIHAAMGGVLFLLLVGLSHWLKSLGWHHMPWEFAIPAGLAISGLVQAATGIPFSELSTRWDTIKPWQRGVYGISLLLVSFALMAAIAFSYIFYSQPA